MTTGGIMMGMDAASPPVRSSGPSSTPRGARVRREVREDGVAVVTHVEGPLFIDEVLSATDAMIADARVRAVVVRSEAAVTDAAVAQVAALSRLRFGSDATRHAERTARQLEAATRAKKVIVALLHGKALGPAFELALACSAIVATDDPTTCVGLPEVKLGVVPPGNGLLRVARRAGMAVALDLGLSGRALPAARAEALGLVDHVVPAPIAVDAACRIALRLAKERRRDGGRVRRWLLDGAALGRGVAVRRARLKTQARTRGQNPTSLAVIDVLEVWARRGFRAAAAAEAKRFGELVVSETSRRLVELAGAANDARADVAARTPHAHVERIAVVGSGLIGAGIAAVAVERGIVVRLKERDDVALGRGLRYVREHLDARMMRGSLDARGRGAALARVTSATAYTGVRAADVVVEAVFEDLALKHQVLRDLEGLVRDDAVLASSTASIPIARIAEVARRPERVLGMHFFAPVTKVPLLEIVRGPATDARALATAAHLGQRLGKTVIVVGDGAGFYTTRTLAPFLFEALRLVAEGVPVDVVDEALVEWGFSIGPLHLFDELGIDLAAHVAGLLHEAFGDRLRAPDALAALRGDHRGGRKNGRGFYLYGRGARAEKRVDDTVYVALGLAARGRRRAKDLPKREEIQTRCALGLVNEALRCLDEGVLASARDGDLGAVLGLGFPAFRGGPFRYVDVLGASEVLKRTRALEQRHGARFTPAPALVDAARRGRRFWSS